MVLPIISATFLVPNYQPIVDRLYGWWWRCKYGSMKVWFFKDDLALDVCKHLRENTNHNSRQKYWDNRSFLPLDFWTYNIVYKVLGGIIGPCGHPSSWTFKFGCRLQSKYTSKLTLGYTSCSRCMWQFYPQT